MIADAVRLNSIIEITGLNPEDYPVASKIEVDAFDLKIRKLDECKILEYGKDIFKKNFHSKNRFQKFLGELENRKERPARLEVRLSDAFLRVRTSPTSMEFIDFPRY